MNGSGNLRSGCRLPLGPNLVLAVQADDDALDPAALDVEERGVADRPAGGVEQAGRLDEREHQLHIEAWAFAAESALRREVTWRNRGD